MIRGARIEGHKKMSLKNEIMVYDKNKYIYLPLICGNSTDITIDIKKGDHVFKGSIVAHRNGDFELPIISSVSGTLKEIEKHMTYKGQELDCIVIENDFKDQVNYEEKEIKRIDKISKKDFINALYEGGIRGLGGADFPTYIKYKQNGIKHLIINAVECEPYITADYALIKDHYEEILECIDAIMTINKIEHGYIAIKKNNIELINLLNTVIGTYPKIKIVKVPNIYPMGWEKNLVKYILKKDYQKLVSEVGAIVNNVSTIYAIYEKLKYNKPLVERIVTITGDMVKKPCNVKLKIGTNISEVLDILGVKKQKLSFISGGPMMRNLISGDELIITSNVNNVLLLKSVKDAIPTECLRCGKCSDICPSSLSPVMIKDNKNNIETLKYLEPNRCIECGLCSYICPAKINVRDYVIDAKKKVK